MNRDNIDFNNDKVSSIFRRLLIPTLLGALSICAVTAIDGIFIGHGVDAMAIAGLAITFPLMNISAAFGAMIGIGSGALTSVRLGEGNHRQTSLILGTLLRMDFIIGIFFTTLGLIFLDPILRLFGASDVTLPYARDYMQIILMGNIITHSFLGMNDIMRASGYPERAMIAQLIAVVTNIVLDYLFIFVFHWGMRGAAIATVLGQVLALCFLYLALNINRSAGRLKCRFCLCFVVSLYDHKRLAVRSSEECVHIFNAYSCSRNHLKH